MSDAPTPPPTGALTATSLIEAVRRVFSVHGKAAARDFANRVFTDALAAGNLALKEAAGRALTHIERSPDSAVAAAQSDSKVDCGWLQLTEAYRWGEDQRGSPNDLSRTGFFTARRKGDRQWVENRAVAWSKRGASYMTYTGPELRMRDYAVMTHLFHLHRDVGTGVSVTTSGADYIRGMGWGRGGRAYEELKETLARLYDIKFVYYEADKQGRLPPRPKPIIRPRLPTDSTSALDDTKDLRFRRLITELDLGRGQGSITTRLGSVVAHIWGAGGYTVRPATEFRRIGSSTIAQWLYAFYATHAEPYPMRISTLAERMCMPDLRPRDVENALHTLRKVGLIEAYWISGEMVSVYRRPPSLQKR